MGWSVAKQEQKVKGSKIIVEGKVVNIGMDVHKKTYNVTALVEGEVVGRAVLPAKYSALKQYLRRYKQASKLRVAYEAGPTGFSLCDKLRAEKIECMVVAPSLIPTESGNRVKTDKRDSLKLARYLESNQLTEVWVLTAEERADRQLLRVRRQVSDHRTDVMRQIKSFLLFHGIEVPEALNTNWSRGYMKWLRTVELEYGWLTISLRYLVNTLDFLTKQVAELTALVRKLAQTERYCLRVEILTSIPGVGLLSAMEFLVELQDMSRFKSADELAAYLGLTPSQHSTGEHVRMGHLTHAGNWRVRRALVECSWMLINKDPVLNSKYENLKARRGSKRAIVAIARKLSFRMRRMLLDGSFYNIPDLQAA